MSNTLEYRGYLGSVEFSVEDQCLCGKVEFIDDLILFDGASVAEIKQAFRDAIDAYLKSCSERGAEPNQPFKGSFNVRIGGDLHRRAAYEAKRQGIALNEFVTVAIQKALPGQPRSLKGPGQYGIGQAATPAGSTQRVSPRRNRTVSPVHTQG